MIYCSSAKAFFQVRDKKITSNVREIRKSFQEKKIVMVRAW